MFYVLGVAGVLISVPTIWAFIYNTPEDHPRISEQELDYIQSGMEEEGPATTTVWQGYSSFFSKGSYWVAILAGITNNMVAFGLMSWLPTFFTEGKGPAFFQPDVGHLDPLFPFPRRHHALVLCG